MLHEDNELTKVWLTKSYLIFMLIYKTSLNEQDNENFSPYVFLLMGGIIGLGEAWAKHVLEGDLLNHENW